jgi:hypothetical protein
MGLHGLLQRHLYLFCNQHISQAHLARSCFPSLRTGAMQCRVWRVLSQSAQSIILMLCADCERTLLLTASVTHVTAREHLYGFRVGLAMSLGKWKLNSSIIRPSFSISFQLLYRGKAEREMESKI